MLSIMPWEREEKLFRSELAEVRMPDVDEKSVAACDAATDCCCSAVVCGKPVLCPGIVDMGKPMVLSDVPKEKFLNAFSTALWISPDELTPPAPDVKSSIGMPPSAPRARNAAADIDIRACSVEWGEKLC